MRRVLDLICDSVGLHAVDPTERALADLGRAHIQREKLDEQMASLRNDLWTKA